MDVWVEIMNQHLILLQLTCNCLHYKLGRLKLIVAKKLGVDDYQLVLNGGWAVVVNTGS